MTVSVIIPNYNGGKYIKNAIESLLDQSFRDFEIVLVDDCSTDNSVAIVEGFIDSRLTLIKLSKNDGMANALNVAIENATGDILVRMDSDDISRKNRIEKIVQEFENDVKLVVVSSWMNVFGTSNEVWKYHEEDEKLKIEMLFGSPLSHPASAFRASIIKENNLLYSNEYADDYPIEDYHFFFKLNQYGKFIVIQEPLYDYRIHNSNLTVSNKNGRKKGFIGLNSDIIRDIIGINPTVEEMENHYALCTGNVDSLNEQTFIRWVDKFSFRVKKSNVFNNEVFSSVLNEHLTKLVYSIYDSNKYFAFKISLRYWLYSFIFVKYIIANALKK